MASERLLARVGPPMERARDAEVLDDVTVTTCSAAGREAVEELERLVTPLAELVRLPQQARPWPRP